MDNHRIYGKKKEIDTDAVKAFYEERARLLNQSSGKGKSFRYATISLTEEIAERKDELEKKTILPLLCIRETDSILDIGCGVGRWAESVVPICRRYVGIDYSEEMIKSCKTLSREQGWDGKDVFFDSVSVQDMNSSGFVKGYSFDIILFIATSIYLNDKDLVQAYEEIKGLLAKGGRLYIRESVALEKRLTLDGVWSTALSANYSAVYRTREEYLELLRPILSVCDIIEERIVSVFDDDSKPETSRWYVVLRKR